jgi:hypothetical protein
VHVEAEGRFLIHTYERRLISFLKRMDAKSADAFVEFKENDAPL